MKKGEIRNIKFKLWRDEKGRLTGFDIFKIILLVYNLWSIYVLTALRYMLTFSDASTVTGTYKFFEFTTKWYVNGITLLVTYMICSAAFVFSAYNYVLKKIKKAKGFWGKTSDQYLSLMMAVSIFNILMWLLLLFNN